MTISRVHLSRGLIAAIVFILLVVGSGFALAKAGYMENPFRVVTGITGGGLTGGEGFRERGGGENNQSFQPPTQTDTGTTGTTQTIPTRGRGEGDFGGRGGENSTSLNWNDFGSVLFNLWFIAAAVAFVMVVGRPVGYLFKQLRTRLAPRRSSNRQPVSVST